MENINVERLLINYKTLDMFKRFTHYGNQELTMKEELENNFIENNLDSPFYGIYLGNSLIARMCLYEVSKDYDHYFNPPQDYLTLWKLEVLPDYRGKGYGKALVDYAKSFQLPIKTNPLINSYPFWEKMGFEKAHYDMERDFGENPLLWFPKGVQEKRNKN